VGGTNVRIVRYDTGVQPWPIRAVKCHVPFWISEFTLGLSRGDRDPESFFSINKTTGVCDVAVLNGVWQNVKSVEEFGCGFKVSSTDENSANNAYCCSRDLFHANKYQPRPAKDRRDGASIVSKRLFLRERRIFKYA
jgi:hypothetical protein